VELTTEPIPKPKPRTSPRAAQADVDRDRVVLRNHLRLYIRQAWHVVEPSTVYLENWHIDLIAEYLEASLPARSSGFSFTCRKKTLIKRLHESGRLKSIDERRGKLRVRRMIDGRRLEVLHLSANVLEHSIVEKTGPIGPSTGAKNDPARFSRVRGHSDLPNDTGTST
jgi:hypothetical protein